MSVMKLMAAPFVECLILVGIHSYLGLHVIRRRIIFVDLALAQIAALGATVGFVFGIAPGGVGCFIYSLTFCLIGAALFSLTRMRNDRVPQEAVIGLVYAIVAALAILVIHKTRGAEHLEDILVGNLLWVPWKDVIVSGIAYAGVGLFHVFCWRKFLLISDDPEKAYQQGLSVRLWDFLFYASFGFVITFSVRVAGVLLVFVFLVAPAILALMVSRRFSVQLLVGWIAGTAVTVMGLYLSYALDLPSGPTVVSFYGVVLVVAAVVVAVLRSEARGRALAWAGAGAAAVFLVGLGMVQEGRLLASLEAPDHVAEHAALDPSPAPTAAAAESSGGAALGQPVCPDDPEAALAQARAAVEEGDRGAAALVLRLLENEETPPFYRQEALALLATLAGKDFGYDPDVRPEENTQALEQIRGWCAEPREAE